MADANSDANSQAQHDTRIEHDSLGDKAVPAAALYGVQTQRAVENYPISGMHAHPAMIEATVHDLSIYIIILQLMY